MQNNCFLVIGKEKLLSNGTTCAIFYTFILF